MALHDVSSISPTEPPRLARRVTMSQPPVLNMRGERVGLGPLSEELLPVYERWLNDFDLLATLDRRFRPLTSDWIRTWFERQSRGNSDTLVFTIWDMATMIPIGNTALQDIDMRTRTAEFGIFIAEPQFRGDGRGSETTRTMIRFALEHLGLENVMLRVFDDNEPAIRTYRSVGFREIGRRRGAHRRNGIPGDIVLMDITPGDVRPPTLAAD